MTAIKIKNLNLYDVEMDVLYHLGKYKIKIKIIVNYQKNKFIIILNYYIIYYIYFKLLHCLYFFKIYKL